MLMSKMRRCSILWNSPSSTRSASLFLLLLLLLILLPLLLLLLPFQPMRIRLAIYLCERRSRRIEKETSKKRRGLFATRITYFDGTLSLISSSNVFAFLKRRKAVARLSVWERKKSCLVDFLKWIPWEPVLLLARTFVG